MPPGRALPEISPEAIYDLVAYGYGDRRAQAMQRYRELCEPEAPITHSAHGNCLYCYAQLTNGRPVCGDACDTGYWKLIPTRSGELWDPAAIVMTKPKSEEQAFTSAGFFDFEHGTNTEHACLRTGRGANSTSILGNFGLL